MSQGEKYHVLPIDDGVAERLNGASVGRPTVLDGRSTLTLGEGLKGMGVDIFISTRNTSYSITADVDISVTANGVIVCQGGRSGSFSFYVKEGKPVFTYNYLGLQSFTISSKQLLKPSHHTIACNFKYNGGGFGKAGGGSISVDGVSAGEGRIEKTQPGIFSVYDLAVVGTDNGT